MIHFALDIPSFIAGIVFTVVVLMAICGMTN